ncbi:MAG TPA: lysylphosphatidylglycerol synthase transmembrane domain-containing protein [Acidimicrobiales bacterium]|nr:lysylphosphatidylglycerol synthase transmembrane domain-containing protein [Acidimicrobiales bacterium]
MVPAPLRHSVVIFLVLLILEYVVVPELVGASKHLYLLTHIRVEWVVAGVVCEIAALLAYALLSQSLLPGGGPGLSKVFRIDLAGLAVSHVLPGGSAGSAGVGYRLLTTNGVRGTDAAFAMATQGIGSAVVLNVLLWFSLVISIPIAGFHPIYVVVALVGMIALLAVAALAYSLTHGEAGAIRAVRAIGRRLPILGADRLEALVRQLGDSLRAFASDRDLLRRALRWAALNWLLDAASLWSFVAAFGSYVNPFELFAAYGIANVLAVVPITPGGLGVIDASAPALLVSFGVTRSPATLAVLAWRLVNFWLPIPVGAAAYVSMRVPRGSGLGARRRALQDMASDAASADPTAPLAVTRLGERGVRLPDDPATPSSDDSGGAGGR